MAMMEDQTEQILWGLLENAALHWRDRFQVAAPEAHAATLWLAGRVHNREDRATARAQHPAVAAANQPAAPCRSAFCGCA